MSQDHSQTTTIDGIEFTSHYIDPWIAHEMLIDLVKLGGPSVGSMIASIASDGFSEERFSKDAAFLDKSLDPAMVEKSISGLFARMDAKLLRKILEQLADVTNVPDHGNLRKAWPVVFQGKPANMYKFGAWALGVQFGNFTGLARSAIEWFAARAPKQKSDSPTT